MAASHRHPRILVVAPEVSCLRCGKGKASRLISARASALGDICRAHIHALTTQGLDVHLATPNFRNIFHSNARRLPAGAISHQRCRLPENHLHLAQDRSFYYHARLPLTEPAEMIRIALDFQREVINRIIPEVQPDLIHCFDWTTGLIPAMARRNNIPCLFSPYRLASPPVLVAWIEDRGIDAAPFWQGWFYDRMPVDFQETRDSNPVNLLASGLFAADGVYVPSRAVLEALTDARHPAIPHSLPLDMRKLLQAGRLWVVAPVPDPSFDPANDPALIRPYGPRSHPAGKLLNKLYLQESLNLRLDSNTPLAFWPTRLDGGRSGCELLLETLPTVLERYREQGLQLVLVSDGNLLGPLRTLIAHHRAGDRAAVCQFDHRRSRLAYGAADFVLLPQRFEVSGMAAQISQRYGALPIAFDGGANRDFIDPLNLAADRGTGFLFRHFNADGLLWAIDQALTFYDQPLKRRSSHIRRIMADSRVRADAKAAIRRTIDLYAHLLGRPLMPLPAGAESSLAVQVAA
jgi:glycogen synthase